jgi:hypothetical protein
MTLFRGVGYDQRDNLCGIRYWKGRAAEAPCTYLLLAPFDGADDQGYADDQVLDTQAEGVVTGSLTVVETAATVALASDWLVITGANNNNDGGVYMTAGTERTIGKAFLFKFKVSDMASMDAWAGWNDNATVSASTTYDYSIEFRFDGSLQKDGDNGDGSSVVLCAAATIVADVEYDVALVLGGYDSNEQPWYNGAVGTFTYGVAMFIKGGAFTNWTLLWREWGGNTATLYPACQNYAAARDVSYQYLRTPDHDYSAVLQPTAVDWFADDNDTSLADHTPNVVYSGGWSIAGTWDIQSNKARLSTTGIPRYAYIETGQSGVFARVTVTTPASGTFVDGLVVRYKDSIEHYRIVINSISGQFQIVRNSHIGTDVVANTPFIPAAGTQYEITCVVVGDEFQAWVDGGNRITHSQDYLNTETKHGLFGDNSAAASYYDNFHVQPSSGYTELDTCPGYAVTP